MFYKYLLLPILALLFILNGCQSISPSSSTSLRHVDTKASWEVHQKKLASLTQYQVQGKFAYRDKRETNAANFAWLQTANNNYQLILTTPFGNRLLELVTANESSRLTDQNNQIYRDKNAELLAYQLTGMRLPLLHIQQWLIGLPGENSDYQLDQQGYLQSLTFTEDGNTWQVNYLKYDNTLPVALPTLLELSYDQVKIKIKVNYWKV